MTREGEGGFRGKGKKNLQQEKSGRFDYRGLGDPLRNLERIQEKMGKG